MNKSSSTPGGMHTGLKIAAGAFLLALSSCGRLINAAQRDIRVVSHPPIASADLVIYNGNLAAGWADWSWAPHNFHSRAELFGGQPCLEMIPGHFQGLYFHRSPFSTSGYSGIMFNTNGDPWSYSLRSNRTFESAASSPISEYRRSRPGVD